MGGLVNDKFMNGFVAGVIADIPVLILDFLIKADKLDFFIMPAFWLSVKKT